MHGTLPLPTSWRSTSRHSRLADWLSQQHITPQRTGRLAEPAACSRPHQLLAVQAVQGGGVGGCGRAVACAHVHGIGRSQACAHGCAQCCEWARHRVGVRRARQSKQRALHAYTMICSVRCKRRLGPCNVSASWQPHTCTPLHTHTRCTQTNTPAAALHWLSGCADLSTALGHGASSEHACSVCVWCRRACGSM